jgi:hypothetical protein
MGNFARSVLNGTYVVKCRSALSATFLGKMRHISKGSLTIKGRRRI